MVCHRVLTALLVFDLQVKFLKEKHPWYKSSFGLFLGEQVFQGHMISVDNNLAPQDVQSKLLECVDHRQKLIFHHGAVYLSLEKSLVSRTYGRRLLI